MYKKKSINLCHKNIIITMYGFIYKCTKFWKILFVFT